MGSKSVFCAICVAAALAVVACGSNDDSSSNDTAGNGGKANTAGSSGKGNAGGNSKAGSGTNGGADNEGGSGGVDDGMGGEGGQAQTCTHLSDFVHSVIKDDTTAKSAPRPVNNVVFCDDPADPAAYNDLF